MPTLNQVIMIRPYPLVGSHVKDQDSARLKNSSEFTQSYGYIFDLTDYIRRHNRIKLPVLIRYFFD